LLLALSLQPDAFQYRLLRPLTPLAFSLLFNDTAPPEIYTLSLHDALPISGHRSDRPAPRGGRGRRRGVDRHPVDGLHADDLRPPADRRRRRGPLPDHGQGPPDQRRGRGRPRAVSRPGARPAGVPSLCRDTRRRRLTDRPSLVSCRTTVSHCAAVRTSRRSADSARSTTHPPGISSAPSPRNARTAPGRTRSCSSSTRPRTRPASAPSRRTAPPTAPPSSTWTG